MTTFHLLTISAFSIALPAVASLFRARLWYTRYLAFSILLWIGLLNEGLSYVLILDKGSNLCNGNLYSGIEFFFLLYLFSKISMLKVRLYWILGIILLAVWIFDNLIWHSLNNENALFRLLSGYCVLYMGVDRGNQLVLMEHSPQYKQIELWLCVSLVIHFMYKSFLSIFNLFPLGISPEFYAKLWLIFSVVNLVTNILYFITIIWIPKRKDYTLP